MTDTIAPIALAAAEIRKGGTDQRVGGYRTKDIQRVMAKHGVPMRYRPDVLNLVGAGNQEDRGQTRIDPTGIWADPLQRVGI